MSKALNNTGRPILYSCEWPLYEWPLKQVRTCLFFLEDAAKIMEYTQNKEHFCASSPTTQLSVTLVITGATLMTCSTRGAPSNPSWTGLPLIRTSSSLQLDPEAGMTPIWYFVLPKALDISGFTIIVLILLLFI